jgi:hypothetical protein
MFATAAAKAVCGQWLASNDEEAMSEFRRGGSRLIAHGPHDALGVGTRLPDWSPSPGPDTRWSGELPRVSLAFSLGDGGAHGALAALAGFLQTHCEVACCRTSFGTDGDWTAPSELEESQCLVLIGDRCPLSDETVDRILAYLDRGGAVVACRPAAPGFRASARLDRLVLGGCYFGFDQATPIVVDRDRNALCPQVLGSLDPFVSLSGLPSHLQLGGDTRVLLQGATPDRRGPVAWCRTPGAGRTFCTTLGHADDLAKPVFRRLLLRAIRWTVRHFG